jgi:hypothetical protein
MMTEEAKELLKELTGHSIVELTSRGNTAIFAALYCARKLNPGKKVLIPDQGGWLGYEKYPRMLELEPVKVETAYGLIRPEKLKGQLQDACALLYENPAGYFAEQDIRGVYEACKGKCVVILDVSGCIGDREQCDGMYADIMVGSFGRWKPVNLGYGGFVSFKEKKSHNVPKEIFNTTDFDESRLTDLKKHLEDLPGRIAMFRSVQAKVMEDLSKYEVIHSGKKGINVVVKFRDVKEKNEILSYCEKNKYEYTLCPRYIRVMDDAVSIELKRL